MTVRRPAIGLLLLGCAAFALRVGLVLALAEGGAKPFAYEHGEIAKNLVAGRGFAVTYLGQNGLTSQQAPLYPLLLSGLYRIFGTESPAALWAMQLLQCAAGAGLALAVVWLAWVLIPGTKAVGWLAGCMAAIYPPHVYMVTHIQVALWAALLLTLTTAVVFSRRWRGTLGGAALAGTLGGLLLLVEPILALALPILALALPILALAMLLDRHWDSGSPPPLADEPPVARNTSGARNVLLVKPNFVRLQSFLAPAIFALVAGLVVAPWLWRNWRVHGEFVFVKSSFGYALWQGNNPWSWGTDKIPKPQAAEMLADHDGSLAGINAALWNARHETLYIDDVLLAPGGYREFVGLSEPERSRLLGRRAYQFIGENPARYARLCGQRLRYFLLWDETNPKAAHPIYRAATLAWLGMSICGLIAARQHWRRLWPTVAIFGVIALFHTLTIISARFRIPVEPLSLVWAGVAPHAVLRWRRSQAATALPRETAIVHQRIQLAEPSPPAGWPARRAAPCQLAPRPNLPTEERAGS